MTLTTLTTPADERHFLCENVQQRLRRALAIIYECIPIYKGDYENKTFLDIRYISSENITSGLQPSTYEYIWSLLII